MRGIWVEIREIVVSCPARQKNALKLCQGGEAPSKKALAKKFCLQILTIAFICEIRTRGAVFSKSSE
jgi:hypothetical protein